MPASIDLQGQRFGRLTVQRLDTEVKRRKWVCLCDCGNTTSLMTNRLTSGHTSSCGCIRVEDMRKLGKAQTLHGRSKTGDGTYTSWRSLRSRCNDQNNMSYGGRGITYCERWLQFDLFLEDMGERPEGTTIDRIDPNGNYEPGNCRWATGKWQARNRRNTRFLYIDGKKLSLMEVADELGIKKAAVQYYFSVASRMEKYYGCIPSTEGGGTLVG